MDNLILYSTPDPYNKMNKTRTKLETLEINELNITYNSLDLVIDIEYSKTLNANLFLLSSTSKWYYLEKYETVAKNTIRLYLKYDILMNWRLLTNDINGIVITNFYSNSFNSDADYIYNVKKIVSKTFKFPNSFNSELTNIMVLLRTY